jgi:hypothetical protein
MASIPAYQKALTGIGRANKEMLDLELGTIPNPTMSPEDIINKQGQFQENIDRATEGFPKLPGIKSSKQVREETEHPAGKAEVQSTGHKVGDTIIQGGHSFHVKSVDKNGKVTSAE